MFLLVNPRPLLLLYPILGTPLLVLMRKGRREVLYPLILRVTDKEVEPEQTSGEQPDTRPVWGFGQPTLHLDILFDRNMYKKLAQGRYV